MTIAKNLPLINNETNKNISVNLINLIFILDE
jgi:hypothetical protein